MRFRSNIFVLAASLFLVGTTGCADYDQGRSAGAGDMTRTAEQPVTEKCGADRYNGVQGVDVSYYQPGFDWQKWQSNGVEFGFARVSDSTNVRDTEFDRNWKRMKELGIIRGAYQFFRPEDDATAQANLMVNKVGKLGPGDLPAVLDLEVDGGQSPATVRKKIKTWLNIVEQGTGKKPIIYTAAYFWESNVQSTNFGQYPLWVANWGTTCPSIPEGWSDWTFWQYCNGEKKYCKNGAGFDRNVFNGSSQELAKFANAGGSTGPDWKGEFVSQSFPLASNPMQMEPGETVSGYIEMKNAGQKAWNGQTHLATTEPRDRNSQFADSTWVKPNRPAAVSGTVAPGDTYKFQFSLTAPQSPGTYSEYFGMVQDGVAWFSEKGGPPDNLLQVKINVTDADEPMPDTGTGSMSDAMDQPDVDLSPDTGVGHTNDTRVASPPSQPDTGMGGSNDDDGLGPMVSKSKGVGEPGCSQRASGGPASLLVLLFGLFGLTAMRRRPR